MRVSMSVEIGAPPEVIWPYLVEPKKTKAWFAGARSSGMSWAVSAESFEWTSEPGGVGSTFHWFAENGGSTLNIDFADRVALCSLRARRGGSVELRLFGLLCFLVLAENGILDRTENSHGVCLRIVRPANAVVC